MRRSSQSYLTFFFLGTCAFGLIASMGVYASYRADRAVLRQAALNVTRGIDEPSDRVLALLSWVHDLVGSSKNPDFYYVKEFRATPVQVLEHGGDCADKSRLLDALLSEIDMWSSMAMCFDEVTHEPTHTVVEARIAENTYMLVDPAYNLFFPDESGGYYDLMDLQRDAQILPLRISALLEQNPGSTNRDRYYLSASTTYHTASTYNWEKNSLTKFAFSIAHAIIGDNVYRLRRPCVLESPQIAVLMLLLAVSGLSGITLLTARRSRHTNKPVGLARQESVPSQKASAQPITA